MHTGDKMISFCTACCNRLEHLKKTYLHNIKIARKKNPTIEAEFVLVNYGDSCGLDDWVQKKLMRYDFFTYYQADVQWFHMSKAKNLSLRLSKGDFLFYLDADAYIHESMMDAIKEAMEMDVYLVHPHMVNTVLGFKREDFLAVGGFDESFEGWGFEDIDMSIRLKNFGLNFYQPVFQAYKNIYHGDDDRFMNYEPKYRFPQSRNERVAKDNERLGIVKANLQGFLRHKVIKNFQDEVWV